MLIEWLEIPSIYEQWKVAGGKVSRGSTNPSSFSKAKMYNTVIQKYLLENGI